MPERKPRGKKRVEFRPNRAPGAERGDWTRRYHADTNRLADTQRDEMVGGKSAGSRKRTILVGADAQPWVDEASWLSGRVTQVHGALCDVVDARGSAWQCSIRRVLRTLLISQRSPVIVGDSVWISDQSRHHDGTSRAKAAEPSVASADAAAVLQTAPSEPRVGVIERVTPRRSVLSRTDFRGREHAIVANCDQLLIVASVALPRPKPHLIDRYLVAAGKGGLRPIIVFNKCDLAADASAGEDEACDAVASLEALRAEFAALGYQSLCCSAVSGEGLAALAALLADRTTVLSGQSGVGKSSLINALQPGLDLCVGEVSSDNEKGRHTTTKARLVALAGGGFLVDTPGIRQFDLWNVGPGELEAYFIEFGELVSQCRFRDCHHSGEEGCAISDAVESGRISERRYLSYLKSLSELARGAKGE